MAYKSITVVKGSGGYGGPLSITPTDEKHKFIYITGGGQKPEIVDKIAELTGMEAVNGFKTSIPDEEIALAIVDFAVVFIQENVFQLLILFQRVKVVRLLNILQRISMCQLLGWTKLVFLMV